MNEWQKQCCKNCEHSWIDFTDEEDGYYCPFDDWVHFSGNSCERFQKSRFIRMVENGVLTKANCE